MNRKLNSFKELAKCKGLKLVGMNIRSLLAKQSQVEAELSSNKIEVLSLTETWLNEKVHNGLLRIPGYKIYRFDRKLNKRGGGLAVYVHGNLSVSESTYEDLNISDQYIEALVITVSQKYSKPITVVNVYRPPQGNYKKCVEKLRNIIQVTGRANDIVIMGDLNIDYANKKSAKELMSLECEFKIKQQIRIPTRVTKQTKTMIDHVYTNSTKVRCSGILIINISNHYPVFIILKKTTCDNYL